MTNQTTEILELAKKRGSVKRIVSNGNAPVRYETVFHDEFELEAFAAALEERNLAQVAMLVDLLKRAESSISACYGPYRSRLYVDIRRALSATQQTADAFLAERDADKTRLEWLEKLFAYNWNGVVDSGSRTYWTIPSSWRHTVQLMEGFTFREAIDNAMAAEKRKQAGQTEGKGGGE